jgi:hypothetical protein
MGNITRHTTKGDQMRVEASEIEKYDEVLDFLVEMIDKYEDFEVIMCIDGVDKARMIRHDKFNEMKDAINVNVEDDNED